MLINIFGRWVNPNAILYLEEKWKFSDKTGDFLGVAIVFSDPNNFGIFIEKKTSDQVVEEINKQNGKSSKKQNKTINKQKNNKVKPKELSKITGNL